MPYETAFEGLTSGQHAALLAVLAAALFALRRLLFSSMFEKERRWLLKMHRRNYPDGGEPW